MDGRGYNVSPLSAKSVDCEIAAIAPKQTFLPVLNVDVVHHHSGIA